MDRCFNCGYCWADLDEEGRPISNEYCHYPYDDNYAPCEYDDDYEESYDYPEPEVEWEDEARWVHEFGQPYDYQEF